LNKIRSVGELEEKDLHELVEEADFVSDFFNTKMGKLLTSVCQKTADKVDRQIAYTADATNVSEMTMLQTKLRFYKYEINTLFQSIIEEGALAQQEIELRNQEQSEEPTS